MSGVIQSQMQNGELGGGHYGNWLGNMTSECINAVKDQILEAVDLIPGDNGNNNTCPVLTIGDYGAADGSASMQLLRDLIAAIRKKRGEIPVQIVYEDQSSSDFNSLFKRVHGLIPDPPTFLRDFPQVYAMVSGASFYEQVMPDNTFHLIMSFMSAHWLSEKPTKFQNSLHRFPDATEAERKLVAAQGAKDWEKFLLLRAKELKSGGMLIVSTSTEDPDMKLGTRHCNQDAQLAMLEMWKRMRDEGKISREEFVDTNVFTCNRYLEELKAPFEDQNSAVSTAGLKLISARRVLVPCALLKNWQDKLDRENIDDRKTWANAVWKQHRCWAESTFLQGLSNTRSQSEKEAVVEELFSRLQAELESKDPREFNNAGLIAYVFAQKV